MILSFCPTCRKARVFKRGNSEGVIRWDRAHSKRHGYGDKRSVSTCYGLTRREIATVLDTMPSYRLVKGDHR